jgi:hypothetical protein
MLFNRLLPYILYFLILELQHIVPVKAKLSREIFYFFENFFIEALPWGLNPPTHPFLGGEMGRVIGIIASPLGERKDPAPP